MKFSPNSIWLSTRDYVIIVLGLLIYAFGFCAFVLPEKVVIGGMWVSARLFTSLPEFLLL